MEKDIRWIQRDGNYGSVLFQLKDAVALSKKKRPHYLTKVGTPTVVYILQADLHKHKLVMEVASPFRGSATLNFVLMNK